MPLTLHYTQVVSTIDASSLNGEAGEAENLVDTRFSGCSLHCLVNVPRQQMCNNTHAGVVHDPSLTFWTYLTVRTTMGVLTAASLMMFEVCNNVIFKGIVKAKTLLLLYARFAFCF